MGSLAGSISSAVNIVSKEGLSVALEAARIAARCGILGSNDLRLLAKNYVGRFWRGHVLGASVTKLEHVDIREELLARPQEDRWDGEMDVVNKSSAQKLLDRRNTSSDPNVFSVCCGGSTLHGSVNAVGNEMERSLPRHKDGGSRVVSQHEHGSMVRRIFAPPTLPGFVRPGPPDGPKHVSTDDPCSDIVETASREIIVNSRCAAVVPEHALKGASREHPIVQCRAANSKRVLKVLTWTSTVSIDGNPKRVDSELCHSLSVKFQVFAICRKF
jgi:hypothetical protein